MNDDDDAQAQNPEKNGRGEYKQLQGNTSSYTHIITHLRFEAFESALLQVNVHDLYSVRLHPWHMDCAGSERSHGSRVSVGATLAIIASNETKE